MTKHRTLALVVAALLPVVQACATARAEEVEPGVGGIITLQPAQSPEAKDKAKVLMADNCVGKKVQVVKEGYVVVGTDTSGSQEQAPGESMDLFSNKKVKTTNTTTSTSTRQAKEWRLTYKCI